MNIRAIIKRSCNIVIFKPNGRRLSFYIARMGIVDSSVLNKSNEQYMEINVDLFDAFEKIDSNIYALMDEGVLRNQLTGADLGLYNYPTKEKVGNLSSKPCSGVVTFEQLDKGEVENIPFEELEDEGQAFCILAQPNDLIGRLGKVVVTFKGYLEVRREGYSVIHKSDCVCEGLRTVYISRKLVDEYHLRNGDEILCSCMEVGDRVEVDKLFTINQISLNNWNIDRPYYKDLVTTTTTTALSVEGEFVDTVFNKLKLTKGDKISIYICKSSSKSNVLPRIMDELSPLFDKVIYINPHFDKKTMIGTSSNIVKFCSYFNDLTHNQITTTLLAACYAKRMVELNKSVAIIIDDIDAIFNLDNQFLPENPVCKTLLNSAILTPNGDSTIFTLVSLSNRYQMPYILKSCENGGIYIERDEIDTFNSYKV